MPMDSQSRSIDYQSPTTRLRSRLVTFSLWSLGGSLLLSGLVIVSLVFKIPAVHRILGAIAVLGFVATFFVAAFGMNRGKNKRLAVTCMAIAIIGAFVAQVLFNDILFQVP